MRISDVSHLYLFALSGSRVNQTSRYRVAANYIVTLRHTLLMFLYHHHHHHHHHMSVMELGQLLTRFGLTYLEFSSEVCHDSFCQLGNSVSLSWVVCHEAFCLHVASSSSCIPVVCLEPVLFLIPEVRRLKLAILPLDLPCSGPVTH